MMRQYILKRMKRYDSKLFLKWSYEDNVWEVWRKMPWGNRRITPITPLIYGERKNADGYCQIDHRILDWLASADTQKPGLHMSWKWKRRREFEGRIKKRNEKYTRRIKEISQDNWNMISKELLNIEADERNYLRPDIATKSRNRISYRSAENARAYFDSNRDD